MKGSRLVWLIDPVEVSLDSLSQGYSTLALPRDLNLNDQLFHYGCRINTDLMQDVVCARILVNTAPAGSSPHFTPQPWYFSPLLTPSDHHPLSKNLNPVYAEFVSSVDTVNDSDEIQSHVILSSSPYARLVRTPAGVSLENINRPPARELFNKSAIPAGILLEGIFSSLFQNRMLNQLTVPASQFIEKSIPTQMVIFSDGSLIANKVRYKAGSEPEILPLGYDRVSRQTFGNKEFFVNVFHYLTDKEGIMQLRNSTIKLRLLDVVKLREEGNRWKWINVGIPVVFVVLFGVIYNLLRKRRYSIHYY
jgi:ABC-2 type transport system permease protein